MTKILTNPQGKAYISSGGKALLSTGSGSATLITKTITQNGTYNASSDNADGYSSVTVNVSPEVTLTRFKDDNNQEIGTHYMDFTDANGNKFKVIALDAAYMAYNLALAPGAGVVTDLPQYGDVTQSSVFDAKETATFNTQKIIDYYATTGRVSAVCEHCRSKSFVINGVTYYGQLPNFPELLGINKYMPTLASMDTSTPYDVNASYAATTNRWSSNQNNSQYFWILATSPDKALYRRSSQNTYTVTNPVLEIPY